MNAQSQPAATGADVVVRMLEARGTKYVFGVPGAKIDKVFDRLRDSTIQTVVCRHEQNAAVIAGGIGRMTGKAGVAIATSGPGVSNLVTGLATANSEGDPLVALGGAVAVADRLKSVHQTLDAVAVCKPVTKYAAEVDAPAATAEVLAAAFRAAESARPGAAFGSASASRSCALTRRPYESRCFTGIPRRCTSTPHARCRRYARANCWKMRLGSRFWMSAAPAGTPR